MGQGVLEGVRIVDFCEFLAGPFATQVLAGMGAEVIKVESRKFMGMRVVIPGADPNTSPGWNCQNQGKLSITLDLKNPKAIALIKKIIQKSDVVMQNFRKGKIEAMGLGYDSLTEIKPDIIMVSSTGYGQVGPYSSHGGYAFTFASHSGLAEITGHPESLPCPYGTSVDAWNAKTAANAIMVALMHKQRTGEGQFIDLSQFEASVQYVGDGLMDWVMNGRNQTRQGNQHNTMAPHNCYRCKGEDKWVSVAVANDKDWAALCNAMGQPDLIGDERFSDPFTRWTNQNTLDEIMTRWTTKLTPYEAAKTLQKAGVAALAVHNAKTIWEDEQFKARDLARYTEKNNPFSLAVTLPFRYGEEAIKADRAPKFGEHNYNVFSDLLGLSKDEIDSYIEEKVIY